MKEMGEPWIGWSEDNIYYYFEPRNLELRPK